MKAEKHVPRPVPSCKTSEDSAPTHGKLRGRSLRRAPSKRRGRQRCQEAPFESRGGGPHPQRSNHTPPPGERQVLAAQRSKPSDAQVRSPPLGPSYHHLLPDRCSRLSTGPISCRDCHLSLPPGLSASILARLFPFSHDLLHRAARMYFKTVHEGLPWWSGG